MKAKLIHLAVWMLVVGPGASSSLSAVEPATPAAAKTEAAGDDGDCGCGEEAEPVAKPISAALAPEKSKLTPKTSQQVKVSVSTKTTAGADGKTTTVVTQEKTENGTVVESSRTVTEK